MTTGSDAIDGMKDAVAHANGEDTGARVTAVRVIERRDRKKPRRGEWTGGDRRHRVPTFLKGHHSRDATCARRKGIPERRGAMTTEDRVAIAISGAPFPSERSLKKAKAAIEEHLAALADAGMVIVPREPTEAMLDSGGRERSPIAGAGIPGQTFRYKAGDIWRAMINCIQPEEK